MAINKEAGPMFEDPAVPPTTTTTTTTTTNNESDSNTMTPNEEKREGGIVGASSAPPKPQTSNKGGILGFFSRLGDLPEWKIGGKHLAGTTLNYSIGFIASCGFLMFGYDQGVLSALLTLDDFQKDITLMTPQDKSNNLCWLDNPTNTVPDPSMCHGDPNTQAAGVAIYQIGCFLGAVLILFYGETWGRKSSTFWGSAIMIIGTIMQGGAQEYGLFVAGRVVGGVGNGMVTSSKQAPSHSPIPFDSSNMPMLTLIL
jgi:hypothetical protein